MSGVSMRSGDEPKQLPGGVRRLAIAVAIAVAAALPGLVVRLAGLPLPPPLAMLAFGATIVAAGFLLSWGAEGETHVSKGLVIAVLALVTVLPEYSVDIYLAYRAGANPGSEYTQFAVANMTGANRLLVGMIWPLLVLLYWWRSGRRAVVLSWGNAVEISFLALASLYSFVIVLKQRIDLLDLVVLLSLFAAYIWRASNLPQEEEEEPPIGPAAVLPTLPKPVEHTVVAAMTLGAAAGILLVTEPFAEALIATGQTWGIDPFLLIQWLGPLASEAPIIVVTVLFALRQAATAGLASLVSDKINQWTLLVGMLPLAYSVGAGGAGALPLDARQREEMFLTAGQSVFGVALLLSRRLSWQRALALLVLFLSQLGIDLIFRSDQALTIRVLTGMGWLYIALTVGVLFWERAAAVAALRVGVLNQPPPGGDLDARPRADQPGAV